MAKEKTGILERTGRLAFRREGNYWNAYYADLKTMDDAVMLGSICMAAVNNNPESKQAFMDLMKTALDDFFEASLGQRATWQDPQNAPPHERGGHG
jgi:hypothetical protein